MPSAPLTHHEILSLVEPFSRRGRHVDLAASNRLERRLVFKPIEHPAGQENGQNLCETLHLDNPYGKTYRLTRVLLQAGGLEARLEVEGTQPGQLLDQIEAVPLQRHFAAGPGFRLAMCHELPDGRGDPIDRLVLTHGEVQVDGLALHLRPSGVKGFAADLELKCESPGSLAIPEDFLAVLGWDWSPLRHDQQIWKGKLRLRGGQPGCSRRAEAKLLLAAAHLAKTLAEPPKLYHERLLMARWGVAFRRAIPLATTLFLLGGSALLTQIELDLDPLVRMMIMNSPPLLLAFAFSLQEMPRFEIPPFPKPSTAAAWRAGSGSEALA